MQVPDGWKIKSIEEIAKVTSGGTPNRDVPAFWGGSIPWIKTTEVQNCKIHEADVKEFITEEGLKNSSAKYVPKNTILMAMIGQGKTRGQVAILTFKATTNQNCAAIIYNDDQCPEYHFNYFLSQYENIRNTSNSAGQSNLSGGLIKPMRVPVPPLPEQQKIAQILSTWDKAIEKLEVLIAAEQKRKKALMQQLLTGKKRFAGFEGDWKKVKLGDIIYEIKKETIEEANKYELLTVKLHCKGAVRSGKYPAPTAGGRPYFLRKQGELIIGRQNLHNGGIAIVPKEASGCVASNAISSFDIKGRNSKLFILYRMSLPSFLLTVDNLVGGTGQKEISIKELMKIKLSVPKSGEQQKIASVFSAADNEIETHQKQLAELKQQKKGLMQQLLTGKKRVKVNNHV